MTRSESNVFISFYNPNTENDVATQAVSYTTEETHIATNTKSIIKLLKSFWQNYQPNMHNKISPCVLFYFYMTSHLASRAIYKCCFFKVMLLLCPLKAHMLLTITISGAS